MKIGAMLEKGATEKVPKPEATAKASQEHHSPE
jgi:hypothetical protein